MILALGGCGTFDSRRETDLETSRIYSGTKRDLAGVGQSFLVFNPYLMLIFLIDLPFSLLADSLFLPVSIPEDSERKRALAEALRSDLDRPSPIAQAPGTPRLESARRLLKECEQRLGRLDPFASDCWSVDARIALRTGGATTGSALKRAMRPALQQAQGENHFVRYADPQFELVPGTQDVRIKAVRQSSFDGSRTPTTLIVGPGSDDGWRILEETEVGWPLSESAGER